MAVGSLNLGFCRETEMSSAALGHDRTFSEAAFLAAGHDHDDADAILVECVVKHPGNREYVQTFLSNLATKFGPPPTKPSHNELHAPSFQNAIDKQHWREVLSTGPRRLSLSLWHAPTLVALGDASLALGYTAPAALYYQYASEADPHRVDVLRKQAHAALVAGDANQALAAWSRVEEVEPGDEEAAQSIAAITIEQSRELSGLSSQTRSVEQRSVASGSGSLALGKQSRAVILPDEVQQSSVRLTPIQQLEAAIRYAPSNPEYYRELAPLYLEKNRDYDAEKLLSRGLELTENDPELRKLWEDVYMLRLAKKLDVAEQRQAAEPSEEHSDAVDELRLERDRMEMDIFVHRCQREPHNLAMRYELGMRLKRAGKLEKALQCFKEALPDAEHKSLAAYEIGDCLQQSGDFVESLKYYRLAADSAQGCQQIECKKQSLYRAAGLSAKLKLFKLAERHLVQLLAIDSAYREAPALLRGLRGQG